VILVDTSVWIDHLRRSDVELAALLDVGRVLTHPFIIGEIALGHLRQPARILRDLGDLPKAVVATDAEVLTFIAASSLAGSGIGYVDAHLLAALRLTPGSVLWTRDRRLFNLAKDLGHAAFH
jgi:predicted nucleic acid-binding protein